jgi:hypothetical protein
VPLGADIGCGVDANLLLGGTIAGDEEAVPNFHSIPRVFRSAVSSDPRCLRRWYGDVRFDKEIAVIGDLRRVKDTRRMAETACGLGGLPRVA